MTQEHPITPPPELVKQWASLACEYEGNETWIDLATQAARWGADQELSECCKWLPNLPPWSADDLLKHRRPKPPSLKEQALAELNLTADPDGAELSRTQVELIRLALESLPS